jgi:hypothetical protein
VSLRDLMNRHARAIQGGTVASLAEDITYRFNSGDPERTFKAVVQRRQLEPSSSLTTRIAKRRARIEVLRHATAGVLTIAKGDSIVLPLRIGDEPVECDIVNIVDQDDALFVVEVEG